MPRSGWPALTPPARCVPGRVHRLCHAWLLPLLRPKHHKIQTWAGLIVISGRKTRSEGRGGCDSLACIFPPLTHSHGAAAPSRQVPPNTEEQVGGAMGTFTMWSTADGGMEYMLEVSGAPQRAGPPAALNACSAPGDLAPSPLRQSQQIPKPRCCLPLLLAADITNMVMAHIHVGNATTSGGLALTLVPELAPINEVRAARAALWGAPPTLPGCLPATRGRPLDCTARLRRPPGVQKPSRLPPCSSVPLPRRTAACP